MTDMFNTPADQQVDPNTDFLSELVGDGKKFKTTAELARGKFESDRHIENLNRTLNEMREELKTRKTEEDLINRITSLQTRPQEQRQEPTQTENQSTPAGLTMEDVQKLFAERDNKNVQQNNLSTVQSRLAEKYGNGAAAEIERKSAELGVSKDELRTMAATRPTVFLALFTSPARVESTDVFGSPQQGRVTSMESAINAGIRKFSDFQRLRQGTDEQRKEYFSAKVQKEILTIGDRLGGPGNPAYEKWRNS